ncbi:FAD/NAD(P)-binding domain-containing protein [Hortaea werneckii]|nr:FAD/NAD(P)-binding domain-containing protein [Hortaea werneckii]KAI7182539.1 FAD/NAD(P)-binding domain-containing protein [Hortaea werneckii]KAI7502870.1 FAD/NAD(P)-binding domain-containing protein [Hortaea werneckii]
MESKTHIGAYLDGNGMSRMRNDLEARTASHETQNESHSPRDMLRAATSKARQIRVGIVGAGFASLRCADVLLQHGCKVTIFEARNRLGGRVAQSRVGEHVVDLGPNWIHGSSDNPMMHLASQTNTSLHAWDERQALYSHTGEPLPPDESAEYAALLWDDGVIADAFRYSNSHHDSIPPKTSLYDFFVEKSKSMFLDQPDEVAKAKRATFLQTTSMWGAYVGSDVRKQSLKFFWLEECIEGENPFVAGTYSKILARVAKAAQERADIRLNTKVSRVRSTDGRGQDISSPTIELENGESEEFDEVVVTCPLGYLKRSYEKMFDPPLPPRLRDAIESIGYGCLDKVYVTFPTAFWDDTSSEPAKTTSKDDTDKNHNDSKRIHVDPEHKTPNVTATTMPLHQPSPYGQTPQFPGFAHFLPPTNYTNTPADQQGWDQQALNLAALTPASCAHPTLLFYTYGACSQYLSTISPRNDQMYDSSTNINTQHGGKQHLIDFFQPYFSRLPNYTATNPSCQPSDILFTGWTGDELAGYGSYCNFPVGATEADKDIESMREGMPERGVWFAGEHTAPFVALGTSTGAWWSGEGVGRRIARGYGIDFREEDGKAGGDGRA